ncbi:MAG TPA: PEP/pyruvate-binding domain-containing protein [Ktedonobacterales bacterium]|nr:PEP/pyruvate-binding domain-containing protein [Ktedonobacterales bacterium]
MDPIIWPGTGAPLAALGGKAAALDALSATELPIPNWFALAPAACTAALAPGRHAELERALQSGDAAAAAAALADLVPTPAVTDALARAVAALCPDGAPVAVRSSAVEEDGARASFAGQLDSYLNVAPADVAARVVDVWRSAYGARALAYRAAAGYAAMPRPPAVLVQRMVRAVCAGVAFSADPTTGQRGMAVVTAVAGLGDRLVAGGSDALTARVTRAGAVTFARPSGAAGPGECAVPLSERQAAAVAALTRACERHFGRPQDIEWAMEAGQLFLLQARPITTLADVADPDGWVRLWDNSNIAESYGGVTTPLTFSFALHVYEQVYRQLARTLGAPPHLLEEHADTFRHMLGMVRGRVYYNLMSWYRLLSLLPGFSVNRRFMEQMMGVKEGLPPSVLAELTAVPWHARVNDARRLVTALLGLVAKLATLPRRVRRFTRRLDAVLGAAPDLEAMRPDELVAHYRDLERRLITHWDAPLLNDLFAMVFYGLLRALVARWCGDASGALANDLVSGEGGIISAEPAARVRELARLAAADPAFVATLAVGTRAEVERAVRAHPPFNARYAAYLERFADRCLEELKLESATLRDDPLPLVRAVAQVAQALPSSGETERAMAPGAVLRRAAAREARRAIGTRPLRRIVFRGVLGQARRRIRDRENLRFERTRVFGRVRRIVVELGRRLYATDRLADPRDVFYLEIGEVLGYVEGTATTTDLAGLVTLRRAAYAGYRAGEPPDDRFETRGAVYQGNRYRAPAAPEPVALAGASGDAGERRQGIGCCPGVVRGRVRIITSPRDAHLGHGEILVAERTDPGWIMLFPAAAGVVVERGSLLSHSAIVARELGIPTIVAARGVLSWLAEGDLVEMDGGAGTITRLAATEASLPSKEAAHARD